MTICGMSAEKLKNDNEKENFQIPNNLFSYRELYYVHIIFILLLSGFMTFRVLNINPTALNLVIFSCLLWSFSLVREIPYTI